MNPHQLVGKSLIEDLRSGCKSKNAYLHSCADARIDMLGFVPHHQPTWENLINVDWGNEGAPTNPFDLYKYAVLK